MTQLRGIANKLAEHIKWNYKKYPIQIKQKKEERKFSVLLFPNSRGQPGDASLEEPASAFVGLSCSQQCTLKSLLPELLNLPD